MHIACFFSKPVLTKIVKNSNPFRRYEPMELIHREGEGCKKLSTAFTLSAEF
jgi:hypothetical protein